MIVNCKIVKCPYNDAELCRNPALGINKNGICTHLQRFSGSLNTHANEPIDDNCKDNFIILDFEGK